MPWAVAQAGGFHVIHTFNSKSGGMSPVASLIADVSGNLYGSTTSGGPSGAGIIFELSPPAPPEREWTETVLHIFKCNKKGSCYGGDHSYGSLIMDSAGSLYGTTIGGGTYGSGNVFRLASDGTETVLYSFRGPAQGDGEYPRAGLVADSAGNLYGTTEFGGTANDGTVFKLAPDGTETVLYSFTGGNDGANPVAGVTVDAMGNLYGTTLTGGIGCGHAGNGCGTVFKIAPDGTETILHSFCTEGSACSDGSTPQSNLLADTAGSLYGTTTYGGAYGSGTVFKVETDGTEKVLYSFDATGNYSDGAAPVAGVIADTSGNLYGTTASGGQGAGWGVVFRLAPNGTETVLHSFSGGSDGWDPWAGVLIENNQLVGLTGQGGKAKERNPGYGVVFQLDK
jgi:uncharacterized repeat protein (TIGR03803 family)